MKAIMITAPNSGSGKTTVTMGVIRALKNAGHNVACFKTGPDYIDTAFLKTASGKEAGNLDLHLQGEEGMKKAFSLADGDLCVIEGAMGYFDGIYNTYRNSSYDISRVLDINCILVYSPKGEMFSVVPKIIGMTEFENSKIKGIILNKVNGQYYTLLKEQIEKYTRIKVLGFMPEMEDVKLKSRHLGLIQSVEQEDIDRKIDEVSQAIRENVDLDALIAMMNVVDKDNFTSFAKREMKVGIARDRAFSFYYRENIALLEDTCWVEYFSPLKDRFLPDCDLLYFGGGYPEVFRQELSRNQDMLQAVRDFAQKSGCIYAECGGLMYLTEGIEDSKMVGIFKGKSTLTSRLQRFGYIDIQLKEDCMLGKAGERLTAHEFHQSVSDVEGEEIFHIQKTMGTKKWRCGYRHKNVLAGYPHIHFLGNMKAFEAMFNYVERSKKK